MKSHLLASSAIVLSAVSVTAACSGSGGAGGAGGDSTSATQGASTTVSGSANATSTTTHASTGMGATGSTTGTTSASATSSSTGMAHLFGCGPTLMCDAGGQYCEQDEGIIVSYMCVDHAPCAASDTVSCTCLNAQQLNCNMCKEIGGGAVVDCGGG